MLLIAVFLLLLSCDPATSVSGPISGVFDALKTQEREGCEVMVLPDSVDWCNGSLVRDHLLPHNTVCQFRNPEAPYLICSDGRWLTRRNEDYYAGRQKRAISQAVYLEVDRDCFLFCVEDLTQFNGKSPPFYDTCPASVTLYPEVGGTEVSHDWDEPIANDKDGEIVIMEQIVGPSPPATFESSTSPGTRHHMAYMAQDDEVLIWPCSFTVTGEIPTCPPMLHVANGRLDCDAANSRGSNCTFACNHGYQLNSTEATVECDTNGTWSFGENEPQCLSIECDSDLTNSTSNGTDIELVCPDDVYTYDTVCWVRCLNDYIIRNDQQEDDLINKLGKVVDNATAAEDLARQEADTAQDMADVAYDSAIDASSEAAAAVTDSIAASVETSVAQSDVDELSEDYKILLGEVDIANEEAAVAVENGDPNTDEYRMWAINMTEEAVLLNRTLENAIFIVQTLAAHEQELLEKAEEAQTVEYEAWMYANETMFNATLLAVLADDAANALLDAMHSFNDAQVNTGRADRVVNTYARCGADGAWAIPGDLYCIDIKSPEIECTPVVTVNLEPGETSGNVTWDIPEVVDNSGSARVFKVTGPEPGSLLELGTYTVQYQADDEDGNLSPICSVVINVEVLSCGLPRAILADDNVIYNCSSFETGAICLLSCVNNYVLDGPDTLTCLDDRSVNPPYAQWEDISVSCNVEDCPPLPDLDHGVVDCTNSSMNESAAQWCQLVCDEGYALPYQIQEYYSCDNADTWTPARFPNACSPKGEQQYTEYTLLVSYTSQDCVLEDTDAISADFITAMDKQLPFMTSCKPPYACVLGHVISECEADVLVINASVLVTCSDVQGNACDLTEDNMVTVADDIRIAVEDRHALDHLNLTLTADWLTPSEISVPECDRGYVLVGAFCESCDLGSFYDGRGDTCYRCPVGTYSDAIGRWACITCPSGTTSLAHGAKSVTDCLVPCDRGEYSETGYSPCARCVTGEYQPDTTQTQCLPCGPGKWTPQEGSTSAAQCTEYDIYFEYDQPDFTLAAMGSTVSVAFWMNSFGVPLVSIGAFFDDTEHAFKLTTEGNAQLQFGYWDNSPTDIEIEGGTWTMIGLTWDAATGDVSVYKNGELGFSITIDGITGQPDRLRMSVNSGTTISGLSISSTVETEAAMIDTASQCHRDLPGTFFTTDDLAEARMVGMKYPPTSCIASNSTDADHCLNNVCQNGGICVHNETLAYACNCTEPYRGPFCEFVVVHGNWSEWYNMTSCSRTCGRGEQTIYRLCDSPHRSEYGDDCAGNSTDVVVCNSQECPESCPSITNGTGTQCLLDDNEECIPQCPAGRILPRGQYGGKFTCGASTGHSWAPLQRLPLCSESYAPISYSVTMTFTFLTPVPCEIADNVTLTYQQMTSDLRYVTDNENCEAAVVIDGCLTGDQTHSSTMTLTMHIPLLTNETLDLEMYYATGTITNTIRKAVRAISDLEQTVLDIINNADNMIFNDPVYSWSYSDVIIDDITECSEDFVAVAGICAMCQQGTRQEGVWCIYCDLGKYQDQNGLKSCKACPINKTTEFLGARSLEECVDIVIVPTTTTTTIGPTTTDYSMLIIILVVVVGVVGIVVIFLAVCYRMRLGAKLREQFDMQADTTSLYTEMPDIAYNIYYKARKVVGFDENGLPVVAPLAMQNGDSVKTPFDTPDFRRKLMGEDFFRKPPKYGIDRKTVHIKLPPKGDKLRVPNMWPTPPHTPPPPSPRPLPEPPSTEHGEPFRSRSKNVKRKFKVPKAHKSKFNFPKIKGAIRFRVPGRRHLQNKYPLSMFGVDENKKPVYISLPGKAASLLYRPPGGLQMYLSRASEYKRLQEEESSSDDEEEGLFPGISPLQGINRRHQRCYEDPTGDFTTSTLRLLAEQPPPFHGYGPFPGRKTIDRYFKIGSPRSTLYETDHPKPNPINAHVVKRPWDRSPTLRPKSSMKSPRSPIRSPTLRPKSSMKSPRVRSKSTVTIKEAEPNMNPRMYSTRYNRPKSGVTIKDDASSVKRPKSAFVRMPSKPPPPPDATYRPKSSMQTSAVFHPKPAIRRQFPESHVSFSVRDEYTESSVEVPLADHKQKLMQPPFLQARSAPRPTSKTPQRRFPRGSVAASGTSQKLIPPPFTKPRSFPRPHVTNPIKLNQPEIGSDEKVAPSFFLTQVVPNNNGNMTDRWVSDTTQPPPYNHIDSGLYTNGTLNSVHTNSSGNSDSRPGSAGSAHYVGLPENVKTQTDAEVEQRRGRNKYSKQKLTNAYL